MEIRVLPMWKRCSPGNNCTGNTRSEHGDTGTKYKQEFIGYLRNNFFLHEHFYTVGNRLKNTKRSGTVWAEPVLHKSSYLAFGISRVHGNNKRNREILPLPVLALYMNMKEYELNTTYSVGGLFLSFLEYRFMLYSKSSYGR